MYTKKDFYCHTINKVDNLYKTVFDNEMIQHCYGSSSVLNEIIIRPYSNNRIDCTINQFNFWITVFSKLTGGNNSINYLSMTGYNAFVDEVFRLIDRYPTFNSFTQGMYLWENKRIYTFKEFPKGVIQISDGNSNVEFLKFDAEGMTFSQYKIEKILHNYQNNNSMYIIDLSKMRSIPNKNFNNCQVSELVV